MRAKLRQSSRPARAIGTCRTCPGRGTTGNVLTGNSWYDPSGNLLQRIAPGAGIVFSKNEYNPSHTSALGAASKKPCCMSVKLGYHSAGVVGAHTYIIITDCKGKLLGTISGEPKDDSGNKKGSAPYGKLIYSPDFDLPNAITDATATITLGAGQTACDFVKCADDFASSALDRTYDYDPWDGTKQ
jgi:hypothetical protein